MVEREKINIVTTDGQERVADLLLNIHLDSTGKDYVLYTFHEVDDKGLETIYASTVEMRDNEEVFIDIATEEEWTEIKKVMKETIKKNQQNG